MLSSGFFDGTGPQTAGTNLDTLGRACFRIEDAQPLKIGIPDAFRFIVRMTDIVTDGRPFSANIANPRHCLTPSEK